MTPLRRVHMIIRLILFLMTPLLLSWFALAFGNRGVSGAAPSWLLPARYVLWFGVVLSTAIPFYIQHIFTGLAAPLLRERGWEPEEKVLVIALALVSGWPVFAFICLLYGGRPLEVYATSAVAVTGTCFWTWRCRRVLIPRESGP